MNGLTHDSWIWEWVRAGTGRSLDLVIGQDMGGYTGEM